MGEAFKDEAKHGKAFDECVDGILEKGEAECKFQPHPTSHYGKIDWCIREANIPIVLHEDKLEFGLGGPDAYMQLACYYDLVVGVLTNFIEIDSIANNYLTHGVPCFLICLMVTQCSLLILASVDCHDLAKWLSQYLYFFFFFFPFLLDYY